MKNEIIVDEHGTKRYFLDDQLHRDDGPAMEFIAGDNFWYTNGKLNRVDGTAAEFADGDVYWYIDGEELTEKEFEVHPKRIAFLKSMEDK